MYRAYYTCYILVYNLYLYNPYYVSLIYLYIGRIDSTFKHILDNVKRVIISYGVVIPNVITKNKRVNLETDNKFLKRCTISSLLSNFNENMLKIYLYIFNKNIC